MSAVKLTVTHCGQCPHSHTQRYYTGDSFEHVQTLFCTKTKRPQPEMTDKQPEVKNSSRIGFLETGTKERDIPIPLWCPLRNEADGNAVNQCKCGACDSCCPDEDLWK